MSIFWKVYHFEPLPLLVLLEQPEVFLHLKRVPQGGDFFRWQDARWRVRDVHLPLEDNFGRFQIVEAVEHNPSETFLECPGCEGIVMCADYCLVGLHRDKELETAPRPSVTSRPRKPRPGTLSAPLKDIVSRRGNVEELSCGHTVHYRFFKFVDKTATSRRCLECCTVCEDVVRTVKRPRIP